MSKLSDEISEKFAESREVGNDIGIDNKVTEEEFQNFMHRVTEVEKIVKKLASSDPEEQRHGQMLADNILEAKTNENFSEDEIKVKINRTIINKVSNNTPKSEEQISQEAFMSSVEKDAKERAENRKIRNERAETFKRIGNGAFKEGQYEKAVTFYTKALEQRKDSALLWNNRAISYIHLGLFEKALADCEWALKVDETNAKALMNAAKCHLHLGNNKKCDKYIKLAKERNPQLHEFINEFEKKIKQSLNNTDDSPLD